MADVSRCSHRAWAALLVGLATWSCASIAFAHPLARHPVDESDLVRLRQETPRAALLLEQGEALIEQRDLQKAAAVFARASAQAPTSALLARRECQTLTEIGEREAALSACAHALKAGGTGMELRAYVAALMSGPKAPTTDELFGAMSAVKAADLTMRYQPWPYAAQCDVGWKIGDYRMVAEGLDDLRRIAPGHYETRRAEAMMARVRAGWGMAFGWIVLGVATIGTALHIAVTPLRRRRALRRSAVVALAALCTLISWPLAAAAQDVKHGALGPDSYLGFSRWAIDLKDPESSVPTTKQRDDDPLEFGYFLMDLADRAKVAEEKADWPAAVRFYRAMAKAVPDRATAFSKLCGAYEKDSQWDKAVESCRAALGLPGATVDDGAHLVRLLVAKQMALTADEKQDAVDVLSHLREQSAPADVVETLTCEYALRVDDVPRLDKCAAALAALPTQDPKTVSYQWALAIRHGRYAEAKRLMAEARDVGMPAEALARMREATARAEPLWARVLGEYWFWATVAAAVLGAAVWLIRPFGARRATAG